MTRLFTYIIPWDDGAAPNPFGGICTLTICKPKIRSVAKVGDWVAGVGSAARSLGGHLVYAMKVSEVVSLEEYDRRAPDDWPNKIADIDSLDLSRRLGDCIYDFSSGSPIQRPGVHAPQNERGDLGGKHALLADKEFYYFGREAIDLPEDLRGICPTTQGHRSNANDEFVERFETWIKSRDLEPGQIYGWPAVVIDWKKVRTWGAWGGCVPRAEDDAKDEDIEEREERKGPGGC